MHSKTSNRIWLLIYLDRWIKNRCWLVVPYSLALVVSPVELALTSGLPSIQSHS